MNEENENPASEGLENSEQEVVQQQEQIETREPERTVPLSALEAERRKRQDLEAQAKVYEQYINQAQQQKEPEQEDDTEDLISKGDALKMVNQYMTKTKQEFLEESFCSSNPGAVQKIEEQLPNLIKNKPWIKDVISNASNRWQRAWELVNDFTPKEQDVLAQNVSVQKKQDAQRIIENSKKPGSPSIGGKSVTMSKVDYMRSIRGTPEWDRYKEDLIRGKV